MSTKYPNDDLRRVIGLLTAAAADDPAAEASMFDGPLTATDVLDLFGAFLVISRSLAEKVAEHEGSTVMEVYQALATAVTSPAAEC